MAVSIQLATLRHCRRVSLRACGRQLHMHALRYFTLGPAGDCRCHSSACDPAGQRLVLTLGNFLICSPLVVQHLDRLSFMQHLEAEPPALDDKKEKPVYYRIANHYK